MTIHLITTCSRNKAPPAGDTRFPYTETEPAAALAAWRDILARVPVTGQTAGLYCGLHSARARAIAARHADVELWFLSAGLGLRHATDPAVTYEATFHDLPYPATLQWAGLTHSPPLPGRQPSLTRLMQSCPGDWYVIAASPVYLAAVEDDLVAGAAALPEQDRQLIIVTSKGYQGALSPRVRLSHAGMLSTLKTNMNALNISHAGLIIDTMAGAEHSGLLTGAISPAQQAA
ncbi:hypothetical protein SAMN03159428_04941 [Kosakonia radicincitans]|uniref:TgtA5 cluster protein 2 n=1 Tax=Kosakonia radicincitans TaxID=283686 RepID=A0AAX2EZ65_9ENTR|nr:hypothetical protein [Kosakonia radicincitans]SFF38424.1 hypothetical protein SAMN03159468_04968 [Kosakonia radicincitans]SFR26312.1 hypothetical protein SAMN03159514_04928 [Kosakonia radicincitans]SFU16823.1 hypothetical protein SAMN03159428_04941 [Kosakonia radicincitans]SFY32292.1 hypothetical protein SAMN03159436_04918 [Kosakonia radicincitans]